MNSPVSHFRRKSALIAGLALVAVLYGFMREPQLSDEESRALASRFHFTQLPLPTLSGYPQKTVRAVHPSLARISAWISSVGAAVALADLDGDGLPNDLCHIDPRNDQAMVAPAPGTGDRYPPFALNYAPLRYDATMAPMGCLSGDLNEDGLADLLVYFWGRPPIALLRRAAAGPALASASYAPVEVADAAERWFSNAGTLAAWTATAMSMSSSAITSKTEATSSTPRAPAWRRCTTPSPSLSTAAKNTCCYGPAAAAAADNRRSVSRR